MSVPNMPAPVPERSANAIKAEIVGVTSAISAIQSRQGEGRMAAPDAAAVTALRQKEADLWAAWRIAVAQESRTRSGSGRYYE